MKTEKTSSNAADSQNIEIGICLDKNANNGWKNRKKTLETLKSHGKKSSPLKKKLAILNKLKNISSENFNVLLEEMKAENFDKFHTEIINNLLANFKVNLSINSEEDLSKTMIKIHRIVEIMHLFLFDQQFLNYLNTNLKKLYAGNWGVSCLLFEISFSHKKKDAGKSDTCDVSMILKQIFKNLKDEKLLFILYILVSFDCSNSSPACDPEQISTEMFREYVLGEISNVNEGNLNVLRTIAKMMGIDQEISLKNQFVNLITVQENEFDFYKQVSDISTSGNLFEGISSDSSLIKSIEKRIKDTSFLDLVGNYIRDKPYLFDKIWKKRSNVNIIPSLARILSKSVKSNYTFVINLISNGKALKDSDLVMISELYKFDVIKPTDFFALLSLYLTSSIYTEKLCILLGSTGRYLLSNKNTNRQTAELLESLKTIECDEISKIHIKNCISKILSPEISNLSILSFLQWYLNYKLEFIIKFGAFSIAEASSTSSEYKFLEYNGDSIINEIKRSKKFCLLVFVQPSIFRNLHFMAKSIQRFKMAEFVTEFYLKILCLILSKSLLFQIVEVIGLLCTSQDDDKVCLGDNAIFSQSAILARVKNMSMPLSAKYKCILILLDLFDEVFYSENLREISQWAKKTNNCEIEASLFNFLEKKGMRMDEIYNIDQEDDSFEQEMAYLRECND